MKDRVSEDHDYNLWVRLHQARDMSFKAREKELSRYGITLMQAAVLFIIETIGKGATPGVISRWLLREPHTVSNILKRMEREGLVKKKDSVNNNKKRQVSISLTEKGQEAYSLSLKRESIKEIMSCLSEEERRQLELSLEKIRDKAIQSFTVVEKVPFP